MCITTLGTLKQSPFEQSPFEALLIFNNESGRYSLCPRIFIDYLGSAKIDQLAPVTAVSGGLVPLKRQVAACARGDLISPHLLPAQACNNLIDLDVAELVSAACTAYAELIQKDVSYPDYLSSFPSSSKKPSPVSQAQPMAGVFNFRDTACAMFSATNPQGLLCMDFLQVCLCNSCLPK